MASSVAEGRHGFLHSRTWLKPEAGIPSSIAPSGKLRLKQTVTGLGPGTGLSASPSLKPSPPVPGKENGRSCRRRGWRAWPVGAGQAESRPSAASWRGRGSRGLRKVGGGQAPARTYRCRPALHPRCGHSCSGPRGFGGSLGGPVLLLHSPHHPSTQALHQAQIWHLRGPPAPPHSPVPGRPQRRHAGPSRHHTRCPSARCARPPGGQRTCGGQRPGAAALWGEQGGEGVASEK